MSHTTNHQKKPIHLDPVAPELQWWALGGYPALIAAIQQHHHVLITHKQAKAKIDELIKRQFEATKDAPRYHPHGNPLWQPRTDREYTHLRAMIRAGHSLDHHIT